MKSFPLFSFRSVILVLALASLTGCSTLQYRTVQSRFNDTVRADNERFATPLTDVSSGYRAVADELTPAYIAKLDPKLRPNAWTLRAVSEWRAGDFAQAVTSSLDGLAEIDRQKQQTPNIEGGRDSIVLTMLPGLVEDSRLRQRLTTNGAADVAAHYNDYAEKFRSALRALSEARKKVMPATPREVIDYWDYQCWRVLVNWSYVIGKLPLDRQAESNAQADLFVKTTLANAGLQSPTTLPKAIEAVENDLPKGHPFRQLIELERQR